MSRKKTLPLIEDFDNIPAEALVPKDEQPYPIPGHWKWVRWGCLGEFASGAGFPKNRQGQIKGDYPFFKVGSLKEADSNGFLSRSTDYVNEDVRTELRAKAVPAGSLVFAKIGEAIRLNRRALLAQPSCIDNNMFAFIPSKAVSSTFLFVWAKTIDLYNYSLATAVPSIRKSVVELIPFPLPPLEEQQRIVEYIKQTSAKIDDAIQRLDAFLDDFPNRRFDLVRALLAGHGLPDHGGDPKQQWETLPLGEILRVSSGRGLTAKEMNSSGTVPVYGGNGITGYHDQACYPAGTIAIGRVGFYCGSVHMSLEECWVTDNALVAHFDENQIDRRFLYFLLGHTNLRINTSSSAQPLISGKKIYDIPVNIPSRDTQKAIVKHVEASLEYLDRIETLAVKSRDELTGLRAFVVQQALQGAFAASPIR